MKNNLYIYGDQEYFTPPSELPPNKAYSEAIKKIIPKSWTLNRNSIWLSGAPTEQVLPYQGFKIHVSSIEAEVLEVIEKTLTKCVEYNTAFKVICRKDFTDGIMSKSCSRSSAGKLITIYPIDVRTFKALIHDLYLALKENVGPYILSDKRYLDSKIVHYRYGGFILLPKIKANGDTIACIKDEAGNLVEDKREAFYHLPSWVNDPFPNELANNTNNVLLKNRYKVTQALSFSNSGGVYKAVDKETGKDVVIKEARPFVGFQSMNRSSVYADQVLENEYRALQQLKGIDYFPEPLDWFVDWEHSFLVEEFVSGIPLRKYRASNECTLVPYKDSLASAERFKGEFTWIAGACIQAVLAAHGRGIVLADISPNNIMVDREQKLIRFIDFDGAYRLKKGKVEGGKENTPILSTPGFGDLSTLLKNGSNFQADWYALSMVLYSILLPVQNLFDLEKKLQSSLLSNIIVDCNLDPKIESVIISLAKGLPCKALELVSSLEAGFQPSLADKETHPFECLPQRENRFSLSDIGCEVNELARLVEIGIKRGSCSNFLPIDYRAFDIHPNALAYGYYGPAVLLSRTGHNIPQHLLNKIDGISSNKLSPGLLVGTAGMALAELELNRLSLAEKYLQQSFDSSLFNEINSFGYGLSGIGFVTLAIYRKTRSRKYLQKAMDIGNLLSQRVVTDTVGVTFQSEEESNDRVGLVHGNSGVALFLLFLYQETIDNSILELAKNLLEYDLNIGLRSDETYSWGETFDSNQKLPYWEYGAGGVGAVIARFYEITAERRYLDILKSIAVTNFSRYSAEQGSFNGLSGLGELLLDVYRVSGDEIYLQSARQIADSVMLFSIQKDQGRIYPGRYAFRLSTDLAHGSSGIGLFLNRISTGKSRWLLDLD